MESKFSQQCKLPQQQKRAYKSLDLYTVTPVFFLKNRIYMQGKFSIGQSNKGV